MNIGNRIKIQRTRLNFTQKELAIQLGLTPKMISFYENEERTPPADILIKLANIFNVSTDYLLGLSDECPNNDNIKKILVDKTEAQFIALLRKLDKDYKDIVWGELKKCIKLQEQEYRTKKEATTQKHA